MCNTSAKVIAINWAFLRILAGEPIATIFVSTHNSFGCQLMYKDNSTSGSSPRKFLTLSVKGKFRTEKILQKQRHHGPWKSSQVWILQVDIIKILVQLLHASLSGAYGHRYARVIYTHIKSLRWCIFDAIEGDVMCISWGYLFNVKDQRIDKVNMKAKTIISTKSVLLGENLTNVNKSIWF